MRSKKGLKQFIEEKYSTPETSKTTVNESVGQYVNEVRSFILNGSYDKAINTIIKKLVSFMSEGTYDRDRAVDVLYNLALKGTKAYNQVHDDKFAELAADEESIYKLAKKLLVKIEPLVTKAFKLKK